MNIAKSPRPSWIGAVPSSRSAVPLSGLRWWPLASRCHRKGPSVPHVGIARRVAHAARVVRKAGPQWVSARRVRRVRPMAKAPHVASVVPKAHAAKNLAGPMGGVLMAASRSKVRVLYRLPN